MSLLKLFLSVQFHGFQCIHNVVQPSPRSNSRTLSSRQREIPVPIKRSPSSPTPPSLQLFPFFLAHVSPSIVLGLWSSALQGLEEQASPFAETEGSASWALLLSTPAFPFCHLSRVGVMSIFLFHCRWSFFFCFSFS